MLMALVQRELEKPSVSVVTGRRVLHVQVTAAIVTHQIHAVIFRSGFAVSLAHVLV